MSRLEPQYLYQSYISVTKISFYVLIQFSVLDLVLWPSARKWHKSWNIEIEFHSLCSLLHFLSTLLSFSVLAWVCQIENKACAVVYFAQQMGAFDAVFWVKLIVCVVFTSFCLKWKKKKIESKSATGKIWQTPKSCSTTRENKS